jgi:uncharacterized protein
VKLQVKKSIIISLLLIVAMIVITFYNLAFATTNPVVWYKFDETSGTTAADSSGNGKTATLTGATWAAGKINNAVSLSGSTQYVSMPTGIVSTLNDFTIATWVKLNAVSTWARIFDIGTGATVNMFLVPSAGSTIRFAITTGGSGSEQRINGTAALPSGTWKHVAVTLSGSTGTLYVDGVQVGTNTAMTLKPSSLGSTNLNYIGKSQYADPYLNGLVDDFRIYDRALSAAEVSTLFSGATPTPSVTPGGPTATPTPSSTPTPTPTVGPTPTTGPTNPPVSYLNRVEPANGLKINSTFWNTRIKNQIINWIPWLESQLSNTSLAEGGIQNFVNAGNKLAGRSYGAQTGYWFADQYTLNTVEDMCAALMIDPQGDTAIINAQNAMRTKLADWIPKILSAQESDGYLHTYTTLHGTARWSDKTFHEGYVGGFFIEAGIVHYIYTNKTDATLYNAAKKLADCWCNNIGPGKAHPTWYDGHEEMERALGRLGIFVNQNEGAGKGDKYFQLAKVLMDNRHGGDSYDQSQDYPYNQRTAVGHSVRAMYLYAGMTDAAMLLGASNYATAVNAIWDNFVNRKWYITGGAGSGETSEGFGNDYSLPNSSYCETCAGTGNVFFQREMNLWTANAKYIDLMETALYNNVLGSVDLNAQNYIYTNPLDSTAARYNWNGCPCCVGNIPRYLLELPCWMYAKSGDNSGLYVNLYVGSTFTVNGVAGTNVQLVQATDYPISGNITITVNPSAATSFTVFLRSPNRSQSGCYTASPSNNGISSIYVNGTGYSTTATNGYVAINRTWNPGDTITMTLPMVIQRMKAISNITADTNKVSIQYGPLVYNLESVDVGNNTGFDNFILSPAASLSVQWNSSLLGGVNTISGTFDNGTAFQLIPNYARLNRGGRSAVWIRDAAIPVISPIAKAATTATSYCSGWENITGINDQLVPVNSGDRAGFIYGNYGSPNTTDWIEYDFDKAYTITNTDIYFFSDGGGILAPGSWSMQYWNGSAWVNMGSPSSYGKALNQWNHVTFTSVSTTKVRANITKGSAATGVIEWQIH